MRPGCLLVRRYLSRYADAELSCQRAARVERHLIICPACQSELDRLVDTTRLFADHPVPEPPAGAWERLEAVLLAGPYAREKAVHAGERTARALFRLRPLAWATLLLIAVGLAVASPRLYRYLGPGPVLAHDVDISTFTASISDRLVDLDGVFANEHRMRLVSLEEARRSCPSRIGPATELPAGFTLTRSLLFETDCCPGLTAEYRRGENWITVVQVPSHHPLTWGGIDYERRQVGTSWCEVHEETDVCSLVHHGPNVNLLVLGDTGPQLLGEVAAFLAARVENPDGQDVSRDH